MVELGKVGEHGRRIGAAVVLGAELGESGRDVALHHMLEEVDDAGTVGKAEHERTASAATVPEPWAIAWSKIDWASRMEPSAARAIIASAGSSASIAFEGGDALKVGLDQRRRRCGAGRNAGSATGR